MSDGLTVPFALAAGLWGVVVSNSLIVTAGVAEIVSIDLFESFLTSRRKPLPP